MLEKPQTALTTSADELDAFSEAAAANLSRNSILLTYKKRKFVYAGKDKTEVPLGTELVAIMSEIRHGHVRWENGGVTKTAVGRIVDRFKVDREVLGEHDENEWPFDYSGDQTDPWKHTIYVPLLSRDGRIVLTFTTHSFYGREAAYGLVDQYGKEGKQHPGAYPVIKLGTVSHKTKRYGDVDGPEFLVIDWQDRPQFDLATIPDETKLPDAANAPPKGRNGRSSFNSDMDDDIPF